MSGLKISISFRIFEINLSLNSISLVLKSNSLYFLTPKIFIEFKNSFLACDLSLRIELF